MSEREGEREKLSSRVNHGAAEQRERSEWEPTAPAAVGSQPTAAAVDAHAVPGGRHGYDAASNDGLQPSPLPALHGLQPSPLPATTATSLSAAAAAQASLSVA